MKRSPRLFINLEHARGLRLCVLKPELLVLIIDSVWLGSFGVDVCFAEFALLTLQDLPTV